MMRGEAAVHGNINRCMTTFIVVCLVAHTWRGQQLCLVTVRFTFIIIVKGLHSAIDSVRKVPR